MLKQSHLGYWPIKTVVVLAVSITNRYYTHHSSYYAPGETVTILNVDPARGVVTVRTASGRITERDMYTPVWSTATYQR